MKPFRISLLRTTKRKPLLLLYFLFFGFSSAHSQQLIMEYTKMVGGTGGDLVEDAIFDKRDNSVVIVGRTRDSCHTGDLPPCPTVTGDWDLIVGKIASDKSISWLKEYGGSGAEWGIGVVPTFDGGYIVAGQAASNDGDVTGNHFSGGGFDFWVLKLDKQGQLQWKKCYGSFYDEQGPQIQQTKDHGYIIVGTSNGSGEDVPGQYVNSPFTHDWFVIKIDSVGNKQWAQTIGGTDDERNCKAFEVGNDFYLIGSTFSHDYNCSDTSWKSSKSNDMDIFLIKLDSSGKYLWNKAYGSTGAENLDDAIYDSSDSSFVFVAGCGVGDFFVPEAAPGQGGGDIWLSKLTTSGDIKWSTRLGDNSTEDDARITQCNDTSGFLISCRSSVREPVPDYYYCYHNGGSNDRIFRVDNGGNLLTSKIIGGYQSERKCIPLDADTMTVVAGMTISPIFADGYTSPYHGSGDIYLSYLYYFPTGIKNVTIAKDTFKIYPNPATNNVLVAFESMQSGQIKIMNELGNVVISKSIREEKQVLINTSSWARGNYIVYWQSTTGERVSKKLFVK
ncbi:MAG: hypothetical protein BGO70_01925 [Bacteroidetes bacterium 43-93]|nr:T9SS type A sorting domain-containing protein [Bacteroidota bacterium]OJW96463.1 MAG: hypothetical protein BGO70_01925 [Bacteroidetes bacterium 43-93]